MFNFNRFGGGCGCGCEGREEGCGERIHSEIKCHRECFKFEMIPQPPIKRKVTRMVPVEEEIEIPCPPKPVRIPVPCPCCEKGCEHDHHGEHCHGEV